MNPCTLLWLGALVVFLIVEGTCPCLLSIWFAAGSLVAAIAAALGAEFWLQVVLFSLVSVLLLLTVRSLVRKYFNPSIQKTNAESLIGTEVYVTASVDNLRAQGQVKVNGIEWAARSTDGKPIDEGTLVRIDRIEGVKLFVTPLPVPAQNTKV